MRKRPCSLIERWRNDKNPVRASGEDSRTYTKEEKEEVLKKIRKIDDVEAYMNEKFGISNEKSPRS